MAMTRRSVTPGSMDQYWDAKARATKPNIISQAGQARITRSKRKTISPAMIA